MAPPGCPNSTRTPSERNAWQSASAPAVSPPSTCLVISRGLLIARFPWFLWYKKEADPPDLERVRRGTLAFRSGLCDSRQDARGPSLDALNNEHVELGNDHDFLRATNHQPIILRVSSYFFASTSQYRRGSAKKQLRVGEVNSGLQKTWMRLCSRMNCWM